MHNTKYILIEGSVRVSWLRVISCQFLMSSENNLVQCQSDAFLKYFLIDHPCSRFRFHLSSFLPFFIHPIIVPISDWLIFDDLKCHSIFSCVHLCDILIYQWSISLSSSFILFFLLKKLRRKNVKLTSERCHKDKSLLTRCYCSCCKTHCKKFPRKAYTQQWKKKLLDGVRLIMWE